MRFFFVTLGFLATVLVVPAMAAPPRCKGTKQIYKGKCRYPDQIKTLKAKARAKRRKKAERDRSRNAAGTRRKAKVRLHAERKAGGRGTLSGAAVSRVFRRRASAFRICYERRLRVNPNLSGKVTLRFTIGSAGRITRIGVSSNSTGDRVLGTCIVGKVRAWRFPKPVGGSVTFTYPVMLNCKGCQKKTLKRKRIKKKVPLDIF